MLQGVLRITLGRKLGKEGEILSIITNKTICQKGLTKTANRILLIFLLTAIIGFVMGCDTPDTQEHDEELATANDVEVCGQIKTGKELLEDDGLELTFEYIEVREIELYVCREESGEERLRVNVYIFDTEDYTIGTRSWSTAPYVISSKEGVEIAHKFNPDPIATHWAYCIWTVLYRAITQGVGFDGNDIRVFPPVLEEESIHQVKFFVDEEDQVIGLQVTKVKIYERYPLATYIIADISYSEHTICVFNEVLAFYGINPLYPKLDYFEEYFAKAEELWRFVMDMEPIHNVWEKEPFQVGQTEFFNFLLWNDFVEIEVPMFATVPEPRSNRQRGSIWVDVITIYYNLYSVPLNWLSGFDSVFEEIIDDYESWISRGRYGRQVDRGEVIAGLNWRRISLEYDTLGTFNGRERVDIVLKDVDGFPLSFEIKSCGFECPNRILNTLNDVFEALGIN